jgi:hypothetical protein
MYAMPVLRRTLPGRRACVGFGVAFGVGLGVGLGVAVGRGVGDGAAEALASGAGEPSGTSPMVAKPSGHWSVMGEVVGVGDALAAGSADIEGATLAGLLADALAEALDAGGGVQPGATGSLAGASTEAPIDGAGDTGAAASPERVTSSTRTHAPRTAAHRGRR